MPTVKDDKPTPSELTTEQKERTDPAYVAAVNAGLATALKEADSGNLIPAEKVWADLDVADAAKR